MKARPLSTRESLLLRIQERDEALTENAELRRRLAAAQLREQELRNAHRAVKDAEWHYSRCNYDSPDWQWRSTSDNLLEAKSALTALLEKLGDIVQTQLPERK